MKGFAMNKKILLVRSTPNDLDLYAYNVQQLGLGKAFCEAGYDYDFITFKKSAPRKEFVFYKSTNGHRAKCLEKPRFRFLRWGINFEITKREFLSQYDLIICQEYYQLESYLISRKSNKVVLYSGPYYNMFLPKFMSPIYDKLFCKKINRNIKHKFVKSSLAYDFMKKKGYKGLHNVGVALDTLRFDKEQSVRPETQKIVEFMKDNKCILYVGALIERKNFPFLLEVYQKAVEKIPDLKFVIIGRSQVSAFSRLLKKKDESYAENCLNILPDKIKNGIYLIPRIDNPQLKYIYPMAKAFLLPSKLEIFGMVLLEAMYLGTPVVTSLNGGSVTLIKGKETGQIVPDFNADEWVEAILKYMNDKEYTKRVTSKARELITSEYNWNILAHKFIALSGLKE